MRQVLAGCVVAVAVALGTLLMAPTARAEVALAAPAAMVQVPGDLVQTVQYYGYPRYYGRPRFHGRPRFYGPGPGYYGRRGFYGGPRFYGRGPGYYGRRGYYR